MPSTKLYLDTRTTKKNGTHPLKILVSYNSVHTYIGTGISLLPSQYSNTGGKNGRTWVVEHLRRDSLNKHILSLLAQIDAILLNLPKIHSIDAKSLRCAITRQLSPEADTDENNAEIKPTFAQMFDKCILHEHGRTKELYLNTKNKLRAYCESEDINFDLLMFEDVSVEFLRNLHDHLLIDEENSINTIAIEMRNIRHVFNFALDDDLVIPYPFRRFKIERENTPFRSLTLDQMRAFVKYHVPQNLQRYKDIFLLQFYLIGINIIDLFELKKDSIQNGRIIYKRNKTKKWYSIALTPEAKEIIDKREGKGDWLLDIHDKNSDRRNYLPYLNDGLSEIAHSISGFPERLTTYWARYTWANIAHRLKPSIPKDDISIALGHTLPGSRTTDTYIDYDIEKADKANKRVIAAVLNKKRS